MSVGMSVSHILVTFTPSTPLVLQLQTWLYSHYFPFILQLYWQDLSPIDPWTPEIYLTLISCFFSRSKIHNLEFTVDSHKLSVEKLEIPQSF